jgi:hypothetical protein
VIDLNDSACHQLPPLLNICLHHTGAALRCPVPKDRFRVCRHAPFGHDQTSDASVWQLERPIRATSLGFRRESFQLKQPERAS